MNDDWGIYRDWFIEGKLYQLPDGTLIRAGWHQEDTDEGTWRFMYEGGDLALEVFSSGLIGQTDAQQIAPQQIGPFFISGMRMTRADLTIDDIRPA